MFYIFLIFNIECASREDHNKYVKEHNEKVKGHNDKHKDIADYVKGAEEKDCEDHKKDHFKLQNDILEATKDLTVKNIEAMQKLSLNSKNLNDKERKRKELADKKNKKEESSSDGKLQAVDKMYSQKSTEKEPSRTEEKKSDESSNRSYESATSNRESENDTSESFK